MSRTKSVEFAGAIGAPGRSPPSRLPQVAIAGRSNVGKSTLLNRLVQRKSIARTSKQPGRTQEINFFEVDERFLIADLPGYGFAKAPKEITDRWGPLIESYLGGTPELLGVILLVDVRRGASTDDEQMVEYLGEIGLPTLFVLTKADKLNRSGQAKAVRNLVGRFGLDEDQVLLTSAKSGAGVGDLWDSVQALLLGD